MDLKSGLHIFSVGIVVKDKIPDENVIEVYPTEHIYGKDIQLDSVSSNDYEVESVDGKTSFIKIDESNIIRPVWLRLDSNRVTSPDVVCGETVMIYRFGNTDNYYWVDIKTETTLRKTEDVTYVFSNTDNFKEELNVDNTYWINISTKNKQIKLHTSDNQGEVTTYDFTINTKDGIVSLVDGRGNYIELRSAEDTLNVNVNNNANITVTNDATIKADRAFFKIETYTELVTKLFRVISEKTEVNPQ